MAAPENNLLTGFYFSLSIGGQGGDSDAAFSEISGLSKELNVEEVASGGENRFKYRLPTTVKFPNLVLKRGMTTAGSPLLQWCSKTLDNGLAIAIEPKDVIVKLLNDQGEPAMTWSFVKAYPVKWAASDLSADKGEVMIETIELAYQYFNMGSG